MSRGARIELALGVLSGLVGIGTMAILMFIPSFGDCGDVSGRRVDCHSIAQDQGTSFALTLLAIVGVILAGVVAGAVLHAIGWRKLGMSLLVLSTLALFGVVELGGASIGLFLVPALFLALLALAVGLGRNIRGGSARPAAPHNG